MPSSADALNPPQQAAVTHRGGPLLILAGAGSGKTRVITHRLVELCRRGVRLQRVLAVTFTNKAAGEMRERTLRLLGWSTEEAHPAQLWIGTFHATCARLLRLYHKTAGLPRDFHIFDDGDQLALCKQVLRELDLADHHAVSARAILHGIDQAKNAGTLPRDYRGGDYFTDLVAKVYPVYQQRLRDFDAVDFGDLLLLPVHLCDRDPHFAMELAGRFDHVLVDEFQDVNQVQYRLLRHLAGRSRQIMVVGDDDQAIYGWRGADVRNILHFERDWPDARVIKLEENYRSTQVILDAANAVIARNPHRHGKHLFTAKRGGAPITYHRAADEGGEARFVAGTIRDLMAAGRELSEFAVFYRTNAQSRVLEDALRAAGLPYTIIGGVRFYDRAEIKDIISYLRLCQNPADEVSLRRVINTPPRGIGEGTMGKIEARARAAGTTFWQALCDLAHSGGALSAGPAKKIAAFAQLIEDLRGLRETLDLGDLVEAVLDRSGYLERLSLDGGPESESRRENVMELVGSIRQRVREARAAGVELGLTDYLEQIALASPVDTAPRGVSLMTVHAAKGLEFPVVFVTGLEDGLFPSLRERREARPASRGEGGGANAQPPLIDGPVEAIEEERRLAYVALTRARERLYLSAAITRRLYGQAKVLPPSRFLYDIPPECLERTVSVVPERQPAPARTLRDDGLYVEREEEVVWSRRPAAREAPPQRSGDDELRVEYDEGAAPQAAGGFHLGQRVRHKALGVGEVRALSGMGRNLKLVVYFPEGGPQTVLARFVEPA